MAPVGEATAAPLRIGLTGGIGSGKSTAAAALVAQGATLIDTDAIARELTRAQGAAIAPLRAAFGPSVLTPEGALDRVAMRELAFADADARAQLEAILHPMIGARALTLANAAKHAECIVFDVPLLAESSPWRARVHRVLVIDCESATQVARVAARPGWTREAAERVVAAQISRAARRVIADAVIDNDSISIDAFRHQVAAVYSDWLRLPRGPVEQ